jgi:hypothetical protein
MQKHTTSTTPPSPSSPGVVVYTEQFEVTGDSEVTLNDANLTFEWSNADVKPQLTGTLHVVNGINARYRVRVDCYDRLSNKIGTAYDNTDGTPIHASPKDIPVDMTGNAAPNVYYVKVALEKQGTSPNWHSRDAYDIFMRLSDDEVRILGDGIDIGGPDFSNGAPTDSATVSWNIGDDGKLTATYSGYLHFKKFDRPGRVVVRAINTLTGAEAARAEGDSHTPADNGHYRYPETGGPETLTVESYATNLQVIMQSFSTDPETGQGTWSDVHSQTVSVAE